MYDYGDACPVSKATSLLYERCTLQITREMLLGASRFSELQKYLPTPAGKALAPLLTELGAWGKTWVYKDISEDDTDVESLVRGIAFLSYIDQLPDGDLVFQFTFTDVDKHPKWFITIKDRKADICDVNMGYEVDVYFRSTYQSLHEIWWGEMSIAAARESK